MQLRFMPFVVFRICQFLIPPALAAVGFYVAALITHHLITSCVCAGLAGLAAFLLASCYSLVAIGPRVLDPGPDATTWSWRVRRGHPLQSNQDSFERIAARTQTPGVSSDQCVPWSGMLIPADLMAPHTILFGMTGSRKSIAIRLILQELVDHANCDPQGSGDAAENPPPDIITKYFKHEEYRTFSSLTLQLKKEP